MSPSEIIDVDYLEQLKALGLPEKDPSNEWMLLHMHGDNVIAPSVFNFQVYKQ